MVIYIYVYTECTHAQKSLPIGQLIDTGIPIAIERYIEMYVYIQHMCIYESMCVHVYVYM